MNDLMIATRLSGHSIAICDRDINSCLQVIWFWPFLNSNTQLQAEEQLLPPLARDVGLQSAIQSRTGPARPGGQADGEQSRHCRRATERPPQRPLLFPAGTPRVPLAAFKPPIPQSPNSCICHHTQAKQVKARKLVEQEVREGRRGAAAVVHGGTRPLSAAHPLPTNRTRTTTTTITTTTTTTTTTPTNSQQQLQPARSSGQPQAPLSAANPKQQLQPAAAAASPQTFSTAAAASPRRRSKRQQQRQQQQQQQQQLPARRRQ
jgi:hypothetical protein